MKTHALPRFLKFVTSFSILIGSIFLLFMVGFILLAGFGVFSNPERGNSFGSNISWSAYLDLDPEIYNISNPHMGAGKIKNVQADLRFETAALTSAGAGIEIAIWLLLIGLPILALLLNLHRIFGTMQSGTPFVQENVSRMRWIAGILIYTTMFSEIAQVRIAERLFWMTQTEGLEIVYRAQFNSGLILVGLIVLALAEVFRYGLELQTEADMTV